MRLWPVCWEIGLVLGYSVSTSVARLWSNWFAPRKTKNIYWKAPVWKRASSSGPSFLARFFGGVLVLLTWSWAEQNHIILFLFTEYLSPERTWKLLFTTTCFQVRRLARSTISLFVFGEALLLGFGPTPETMPMFGHWPRYFFDDFCSSFSDWNVMTFDFKARPLNSWLVFSCSN